MRPLHPPPSMNDDDLDPWRRRVVLLTQTPNDGRRWRQLRGGRAWLSPRRPALEAALECSRISATSMFEDAEADVVDALIDHLAVAGVYDDAPADGKSVVLPAIVDKTKESPRKTTTAPRIKIRVPPLPSRPKVVPYTSKDTRRVSCYDECGQDESDREGVAAGRELVNEDQLTNFNEHEQELDENPQGRTPGAGSPSLPRRRVSAASPVLSSLAESTTTAVTTTTETPEDESEEGDGFSDEKSTGRRRRSGRGTRSNVDSSSEQATEASATAAPPSPPLSSFDVPLVRGLPRDEDVGTPGAIGPGATSYPLAEDYLRRTAASFASARSDPNAIAVSRLLTDLARQDRGPPPPVPAAAADLSTPPVAGAPRFALEAALVRACRDRCEIERRRDALLRGGPLPVPVPTALGRGPPPAVAPRRQSLLSDLAHAAAAAAPLPAPPCPVVAEEGPGPEQRRVSVSWHYQNCPSAAVAANMDASRRSSRIGALLYSNDAPPRAADSNEMHVARERHQAGSDGGNRSSIARGAKRPPPPTADAGDANKGKDPRATAHKRQKQKRGDSVPTPSSSPPKPPNEMARRSSAVSAERERAEFTNQAEQYKKQMRPPSPAGPLVRPTTDGDMKKRQTKKRNGEARASKYVPRTLVVHKPYKDWSDEPPPPLGGEGRSYRDKARGGINYVFPARLHAVLSHLEEEGRAEGIASWRSHGRAFAVHNPNRFIEMWPTAVSSSGCSADGGSHMKFSSFQRQLNLYGFLRISAGRDKGSYYHPMFLRGRMFLAHRIPRLRLKGNRCRAGNNPDEEPDFYSMEPVRPLVEQAPAATPGPLTAAAAPPPPQYHTVGMYRPPPPFLPPMNIPPPPPGTVRGGGATASRPSPSVAPKGPVPPAGTTCPAECKGLQPPPDLRKVRHYVHNN